MFSVTNNCMSIIDLSFVPKQAIIPNLIATLSELLFEICNQCDFNKIVSKMPAIPQGAYATYKVKEREMKLAKFQKMQQQENEKMFYTGKYLELSPLKYNSKLMNSIWGLYNRYSVHNFKKITDAEAVVFSSASSQNYSVPSQTEKNAACIKEKNSTTLLVSEWLNVFETQKNY